MTTILTKKKDTTGAPGAGDLTNASGGAELAVNTFDKRLYTKDSSNNVVEVGTNPTVLQIDNIRIDVNAITSTNTDGNIDLTPNGTGEVNISKVDIDSGTIDGTVIGGATAAAGSFTTLNTSGQVVFNDAGADVDFRVEGDTDANLLFVDASADAVGVGTNTPSTYGKFVAYSSGGHFAVDANGQVNSTQALDVATAGGRFTGSSSRGALGAIHIEQTTTGADGGYIQLKTSASGSTSPTTRMTLDSSGNLGIGTSSPSTLLTVSKDQNAETTLAIVNGNAGASSATRFDLQSHPSNYITLESFSQNATGTFSGITKAKLNVITENSIAANSNGLLIGTTSANPLYFITNSTERARITSGGYFKASNSGSYVNSTSLYHEFVQSVNDRDLWVRATDASFTSVVLQTDSTRSQSSAFDLLVATTGNNADAEFVARGDGNCFADGTFNNNGADYAEYFESINGQALTLGATVVLDGNKVREATDQDPASSVIGVVRPKEPSKASMVIGNTAWNKWANKYLTDDFDRYIMEDHDVVEWEETITDEEGNTSTKQHSYESHAIPEGVTVPADATRKTHDEKGNKFQHYKLNPAWNPDAEYVNRENRPEWNIIGLLGQVKILKGQSVGDRWIKMRDVSETVEEWMIR